jgi:hypothetical protein
MNTDFKDLVSFFLTLLFFPPGFSLFSLLLLSYIWVQKAKRIFLLKKESLPTSQFYIFPQALNSLIFFPFKMRMSLARNWLDVRTGASGSSNLSDSLNKPIPLPGLLHMEQARPSALQVGNWASKAWLGGLPIQPVFEFALLYFQCRVSLQYIPYLLEAEEFGKEIGCWLLLKCVL